MNGERVRDEFDVPLGGLPQPGRIRFERSRVETAVAEFRFASERQELSLADAQAIWDALGSDRFPHFDRGEFTNMLLQVSPARTEQTTVKQQGWSLSTKDRSTSVLILADMLTVSTSRYERFSTSLGDLVALALDAFTAVLRPELNTRVGLRYVNRLSEPEAETAGFWSTVLTPSFAGPLNEPTLARLVAGAHHQLFLRLTETSGAVINSGVIPPQFPDGKWDYLLDTDVSDEHSRATDVGHLKNTLRQLNRTALSLFTIVFSDGYQANLGRQEIGEATP